MSTVGVDPVLQVRIGADRVAKLFVGQLDREGKGRVGQRKGRSSWNRPGHIRDAVVEHLVDIERRVAMGRRSGRFDAATLIDRDVDDHRAPMHRAKHIPRYHPRRGRSRDEDRANHQIGVGDRFLDRVWI